MLALRPPVGAPQARNPQDLPEMPEPLLGSPARTKPPMTNLIGASTITALLLINFGPAMVLAAMSGEYLLVFGLGVWLVPSFIWLFWAIRRYRRQNKQSEWSG